MRSTLPGVVLRMTQSEVNDGFAFRSMSMLPLLSHLDGVFYPLVLQDSHPRRRLSIVRLRRTEGLAVVTRRVETANVLLAGGKHIACIGYSFCARLGLLG
ncbi:hypothetical protein D3C79_864970 [compost metagenome]